jgi:hypothetical protein
LAVVFAVLAATPIISAGRVATRGIVAPSSEESGTADRSMSASLVAATGPSPSAYQLGHSMAWSELAAPPVGFGSGGGMVANSSSGIATSFGGVEGGVLVNTTFNYTESVNRWTAVATPTAPTPRSDFSFALDPTTGTAVLFGGLTDLATLAVSNDTWTYDLHSAEWSLVTTSVAPAAREAAAFAVDPVLGLAFLYGGWNRNYSMLGSITYSDLWEFNLSTGVWSAVAVSGVRPPPLEGAVMAWDPGTQRIEMFGGCYPCSSAVWQFDPVSLTWTSLSIPAFAPAPRAAGSWTYDPSPGVDLLFGGTNGVTAFNDTYLFFPTNDTWAAESLPPAPPARSNAASAFLNLPGNVTWLMAGGLSGVVSYSDLWVLSETSNLSLRVVNASAPLFSLAGADVALGGRSVGSTGPTGDLNLTQVDTTDSTLNVTDVPYYFSNSQTIWLPPGVPGTLTVALDPEPLGTVHVGVNASGASTGPVSGASIYLSVDSVLIDATPTVTNATGNATFYGVPPGEVTVATRAAAWRPATAVAVLAPGGVLNLTLGMFPDPVLSVAVDGLLPGGVLYALTDANVTLNGTAFGLTNGLGLFSNFTSFLGLTFVAATAPGFRSLGEEVPIPYTGSDSVSLVLTSHSLGQLVVTVTNVRTGGPIEGALVSATTTVPLAIGSYTQVVQTGGTGATALTLPEGNYTVSAQAVGYYASAAFNVSIVPGPNLPQTIALVPLPPANVTFIVRDQGTGRPIDGANVTIQGARTGFTNAHGYYNATNLVPGIYEFTVTADGYEPNSTGANLGAAENLTLVVNLTAGPLVPGGGGSGIWPFALFPGSLDELWPFLLLPGLLVVGAFVTASILRGGREDEEPPTVTAPASSGSSEEPPPGEDAGGTATEPSS